MKRRHFLGQSAFAAGDAFAGTGFADLFMSTAKAQESQSPPNIVVIVADDAGWRDVGWHGSEIRTPHLDRMAGEGVALDNFYVYAVCSPTRAALMTGRPPTRNGIAGPLQYRSGKGLPPGTVTLAELLRRRGYDTCITGKWHLGMEPEFIPNNFGFRHSYGYVGPWIDSYTHDTTDFRESMESIRQWHRNGEFVDEAGEHVTDLITREALRFIHDIRDRTKPFFLYVPYSAPHVPCQEDLKWVRPYEDTIENTSRRYFAAAMTHMDDGIGQILTALENAGLDDNTLVLFFSDNGGQKGGEYERWLVPPGKYYMSYGATDVLGDNTPLRDWKGGHYEGGVRVPACAYWPGRLKPGIAEEPMYVCDILPTLAGLAGTDVPSGMKVEGIDVWKAINGGSTGAERRFYWHTSWQYALRRGDWKLIHKGRTLEDGTDELYNIAEDPYEKHDRARELPDLREEMKRELAREAALDRM